MKKLFITSLIILGGFCSVAQNSNFSSGDRQLILDYQNLCDDHQMGYPFLAIEGGNVPADSVYREASGTLRIKTGEVVAASVVPAYFEIWGHRIIEYQGVPYDDSCCGIRWINQTNQYGAYYGFLNLSEEHGKVIVYAKANKPATVKFFLAHAILNVTEPDQSSYTDGIGENLSLTTEEQVYELDFSAWDKRDKVNLYGLILNDPELDVSIRKIVFGQTVISLSDFNTIKGRIFRDGDDDCIYQPGEHPIADVLVKAEGSSGKIYYGRSDENGNYEILVRGGDDSYTLTEELNLKQSKFITLTCTQPVTVNTSGTSNTFSGYDYGNHMIECVSTRIDISSDRHRRCFRNNTYVSYRNIGSLAAANTVVKVTYPDYVVPISSVPAWSYRQDNVLYYNLGDLAPAGEGYIYLVDSVVCGSEEIRGLTQCIKAEIKPVSDCNAISPLWDRSSVNVKGACDNNEFRFVITNEGSANMSVSSPYKLFLNDTLIYAANFQLQAGDSIVVTYPADGATMRLETTQTPDHPTQEYIQMIIEACNRTNTSRFASSPLTKLPERPDEVAMSCLPIVDSYDPNDKQGIPFGYTENHLIPSGEKLTYTIRFQNTGSDLAYNVYVVDTLDAGLDVSSIAELSASHNLKWQLIQSEEHSILLFTFNNINLKDSTTNEAQSHGLVSFTINTKQGLTDGTYIYNKAFIFFDYNSAVVTNSVDHTIGTYSVSDFAKGSSVQVITAVVEDGNTSNSQQVLLYPNPASDMVQVKFNQAVNDAQLVIMNLSGYEVYTGDLKGDTTSVPLNGLSAGMYLYKVISKGGSIGIGKLIVK